ncbi:MAG: hypothetical protein GWP14_03375 [Actinobacteria bacterium]|nr:hypothetical protein [Actinomycetota bacterium]
MSTQETIKHFCEQCRWAKLVYNEYCCLYQSGEDRLDLLEKKAHNFFYDLQGILIHYILLNICKLTDPAHLGPSGNLTIKYILEQIEPTIRDKLGLDDLSDEIHKFRDYIIDARHKLIVHLDVDTIRANKILGAFPESEYEKFWVNLQEFVNKIYNYYLGDTFPLDHDSPCEAEDLVHALKKAAYFDHHFRKVVHSNLLEQKEFRYRNA